MIIAQINGRFFFTLKEISILEACKFIGIKIPRFCYQENLSIAGNCRMCLVEIAKSPKPVASCAVCIEEDMVINTEGPIVLKARTNVLELLLLNHPLDCPICDQGGECDLQDHAEKFGNKLGRYHFNKRVVEDKDFGPLIKTIMTRCIHCTRCVRFTTEICGTKFLGTLGRGNNVEIGNYINKIMFSGILSNVIDLCPVGALTFNPNSFQMRSWEVKTLESIDLMDGLGGNIYICYKEMDIVRVLPKKNTKINETWITDKARFCVHNTCFWNSFFFKDAHSLFLKLSASKRILCLVNCETNLQTLNTLQQISYLSKGSIKIKHFLIDSSKVNYYFWSNYSRVQNISTKAASKQFYMFLSSNLNMESTLLNIRIRSNFFLQETNIYSFGTFFKSSFPIFCLKLNVQHLARIFSAKNYLVIKFFLTNQVFLFYGKSLINRIDSNIIIFLKKKLPNLKDYKINTFCNSESLNYLNINSCTTNDFKKYDFIYSFFLEDNILLRKKSLLYSYKMVWLNNFITKISQKVHRLLLINDSNKEGIFLNLEKRPQIAFKPTNFFSYRSSFIHFIDVLKEFYLINSFEKTGLNFYSSLPRKFLLKILYEILTFSHLFDKSKLNLLSICSTLIPRKLSIVYNNYPLKLIINDFFRTNLLSKNSAVLLKCSKLNREKECSNFN